MNATKVYNDMTAFAARADVCDSILDAFRGRGITDPAAIATVRAMRNSANRRYEELRPVYARLWREAHARASSIEEHERVSQVVAGYSVRA